MNISIDSEYFEEKIANFRDKMKFDDWQFFEMKMDEKLTDYKEVFEGIARTMLFEYLSEAEREMRLTQET